MNSLDYVLYKTRKSVVEACTELLLKYDPSLEISLLQCSHCSIWLKPQQLIPDLDSLDICEDCYRHYGA